MRRKITVVGSGNVGASAAHRVALKGLGDVVLLDILEGIPQGKALDLLQCGPIEESDVQITGTQNYEETANSDLVIITAGSPRKPGMSRTDLVKINTKIVSAVTREIVKYSPQTKLLVVSNPLDAMVFVARQVSDFPRARVFGMSGVLDSARMRTFIAGELGCSVTDVMAIVLGGHGDTMVPLINSATVAGIPVRKLLSDEKLERIVERTRKGGGEIVNLLKTGSAYYTPGSSAVEMADAVLNDRQRIMPTCAYLEGEYGFKDVYLGVPCQLGHQGMEKVVEIDLEKAEREALANSAEEVRSAMATAREFL